MMVDNRVPVPSSSALYNDGDDDGADDVDENNNDAWEGTEPSQPIRQAGRRSATSNRPSQQQYGRHNRTQLCRHHHHRQQQQQRQSPVESPVVVISSSAEVRPLDGLAENQGGEQARLGEPRDVSGAGSSHRGHGEGAGERVSRVQRGSKGSSEGIVADAREEDGSADRQGADEGVREMDRLHSTEAEAARAATRGAHGHELLTGEDGVHDVRRRTLAPAQRTALAACRPQPSLLQLRQSYPPPDMVPSYASAPVRPLRTLPSISLLNTKL
ncbi:hypothetical protein BDZ90DRAFT_123377 [Jaminaea rosea]|uniref:Uncharacterized protein n=1 Tax=Jaminaea rosea TaxID=1569628 RepID=A0A316UGT9_9BASI|nr:hypothetical protein BDZ90DRAFT_123377 [Jaminaea rosea]PWN24410.1 hypothetical protein BDZ90DRAFT_123377 [Jaminaea rosea]